MKTLWHLRKAAGITQIELSQRTGIDRVRLSFAENAHIELSAEEQSRITKVILKAVKENQERTHILLGVSDDKALVPALRK